MKKLINLILMTLTLLGLSLSVGAQTKSSATATYKDIEKTFGFVPQFLKAFPEEGISGAWLEMKSIQMNPNTALSGKQKELIGLAVSSQIPCRYCIYFHTKAAKVNGASDREIKEAVAMAALTRHWSTWVNGLAMAEPTFQAEIEKAMNYVKNKMDSGAMMPNEPAEMTDPAAALADIKNVYGFVPTFLNDFPAEGLVGAWKTMRALELNPKTALSGKDKDLIGMAVSAQIPCRYCTYFHTQALTKLEGATNQEIRESVAMASIVRQWSTVLNGMQINEKNFRSEVDRIFNRVPSKISEN
jgi:AhpD family alkylhydroperoxidase